jgi:RimJ/RimL family protein N-acetyltransferase
VPILDTVITARLVLRPFRGTDLDDLHAIQSRADVVRYLPWGVRSRDEVREALHERLMTTRWSEDDDSLAVAVQRQEDGRVIGYINLWLRSVEHEPGEIGVVFHPDARGRGYATEAAAPVLDLAFTKLLLHRVTAGPMRATRHQPR